MEADTLKLAVERANTRPNWANCPSTHCERREECCSPSECTVQRTGRRALLPAFKAHCEAMYGGPLPDWPDDPFRWDERFGGLPYSTVMANRFRDFMAGFDAAWNTRSSGLEREGKGSARSQPCLASNGQSEAEPSAVPWSRQRACDAARAASYAYGQWVPQQWLDQFFKAYEAGAK